MKTIRSVCRAVLTLDRNSGRLVDWLAREVCVRRLRLPAVVGFRDGDYERAAVRLRGRSVVMAVWPRWLAGEGELRDLLKPPMPRASAPIPSRRGYWWPCDLPSP